MNDQAVLTAVARVITLALRALREDTPKSRERAEELLSALREDLINGMDRS